MSRAEVAEGLRLSRSPASPPPGWFDIRADIAARVLSGSGIEIGALHSPLAVPAGVTVRYVDRVTVPELRCHYPELDYLDLVDVDIVDDGEQLARVDDGSLDFIIANQFLEHCHDPITTIGTHLRKLNGGGALFYAIPDRRFTVDVDRDVTPREHMIRDHEDGPDRSREQHFDEWARYVYDNPEEPVRSEEEIQRLARELDEQDYSIHTHVFTQKEILELILRCRERYSGGFDIEVAWRNSLELIVVLRKPGAQAPPRGWIAAQAPASPAARPAAKPTAQPALRVTELARAGRRHAVRRLRSGRRSELARAGVGVRVAVPLSVLGLNAGRSASGAEWKARVEIGRIAVPALELTGEQAEVVYPLERSAGVGFHALLGAPAGGSVRAALTLRSATGAAIATWERTLAAGSGWTEFHAELPRTAAADGQLLCLSCATQDGGAARVAWGEPRLLLPDQSVPALPLPPITRSRAARGRERPVPAPVPDAPLFSVLMPVHDPAPEFLRAAIDSVRAQTFERWQLCLSDDGSQDPTVRELLEQVAADDQRIALTRSAGAGGISAASNAALALAVGEYVALVDHDDLIAPDALEVIAARLEADPSLDMVYSDEDRVSEDGSARSHVFLKPGWSPELFRSAMYTCHLGVYRRRLVQELGGFRSELDGAQDYDLVLRLIERTTRIAHVPKVLYSWRMHPGSTASGFIAKPRAAELACLALTEHLERTGVAGTVELGPLQGWYRVRHAVDRWTRVAVLMPVVAPPHGGDQLQAFTETVRAWSLDRWPGVELFLAGSAEALQRCARLSVSASDAARFRFCEVDSDRHWTSLVNAAARETDCELLLLCPAAIAPLHESWCEQLVGLGSQPELAAAGGTLLGPHGEVDRGPLVFGDGWPLQVAQGCREFAYPFLLANFRSLNGPVLMRAELFEALGGLDPELAELAIADLCLRAGQRGLRSALCAEVSFRALLGGPPPPAPELLAAFRQRWRALGPDPYYNPGYCQSRGDFIPAA